MIAIEHINLVVNDIPKTLLFYQAAFPHWKIRGEGESEWNGKMRKWLHFGDDFQYLTFNDNGIGENRNLSGHQIGLAHCAFITSNIAAVIDRLTRVGFEISNHGTIQDHRKNVYFIDADGFEIEFVEYLSDLPVERNVYE